MNETTVIETEKLRYSSRTLRMIVECNQVLNRAVDEDGLLRDICRIAVDQGGYRLAWIGRAETDADRTVRPIAQAGSEDGYLQDHTFSWAESDAGNGPVGLSIRTREPVIIRNVQTDPRMIPWREAGLRRGYRSIIALPLIVQSELLGSWAIYSALPNAFDEPEVALLTELARDVMFGLSALRTRAESQRAAEALRNREATLRGIFRTAPVGIGVLKNRVIVSANNYWCDLVGRSSSELIGSDTRIFYETDAEYERVGNILYEGLAEKGIASVESRHLCKNGLRDVVLTVAPIDKDDPSAGVVALTHDITAYKEAERTLDHYSQQLKQMVEARTAELLAANQELEAIFQSANLGIAVLHNQTVQRCNARLEEMLGYRSGEVAGGPVRAWYADEADFDAVQRDIDRALRRGETHQSTQRCRRKDGRVFWARQTDRALDTSDPSKGLVAVVEDITFEREYEESLKLALRRAEDADRLKSAFLATMSHELRTPLNSIIGFTGILLQKLAGPLNDEQLKQLGMVQGSARHLLALINDVLDISKIEAGQMQVRLEPFDMRATLGRVVESVRPLAEKKGLDLRVALEPGIGEWTSDSRRVEQVLLNLLNNAVKFTDLGTVTLTVSLAADALLVSVADTGIGIKPEDLCQLFQPFRQVDTGLARQHEGTGLGLAICRRLSELLGGDLRATSTWGKGSVFTFTLPKKGQPSP